MNNKKELTILLEIYAHSQVNRTMGYIKLLSGKQAVFKEYAAFLLQLP